MVFAMKFSMALGWSPCYYFNLVFLVACYRVIPIGSTFGKGGEEDFVMGQLLVAGLP